LQISKGQRVRRRGLESDNKSYVSSYLAPYSIKAYAQAMDSDKLRDAHLHYPDSGSENHSLLDTPYYVLLQYAVFC